MDRHALLMGTEKVSKVMKKEYGKLVFYNAGHKKGNKNFQLCNCQAEAVANSSALSPLVKVNIYRLPPKLY